MTGANAEKTDWVKGLHQILRLIIKNSFKSLKLEMWLKEMLQMETWKTC